MTYSACILGSLICDETEARRLADAVLAESTDEIFAVSAFAEADGRWRAEFYLADNATAEHVRAIVLRHGGGARADALMFETLQQQDWVANSLVGLKTVTAGRFAVHGAHDRGSITPNRIGIEIEAALAFGTGHHGTTLGCLRAIEWIGRVHKPRRVLDVGTGTGVLAIAAARTFQVPVIATEIDPASVHIARENMRANRAASLVAVLETGHVSTPVIRQYAPYDVVLANILLPVLRELARPLRRLLAPKAFVVLSGLLPHQALAALARYRAQGLRLVRSETIENWTTLILRRP